MHHSLSPVLLAALFAFGCEVPLEDEKSDDTQEIDTGDVETIVWEDRRHSTSVTFQDAHAVGSDLIVVTTEGQTWRYTAGAWTNLPLDIDEEDLNGIWGEGGTDNLKMVGVGAAGIIIEWNGSTWEQTQESTALFQAVDGSNANDLIAVGGAGPWRNVSGTWTGDPELGHEKFADVWYDGTTALAVGDNGKIAWLIDGEWTLDEVPVDTDLYSVSGVDFNEIWVAGAQGTLLKWNGTAWQTIELKASGDDRVSKANMWAVWAPSASSESVAFVVGANGEAYKVTGTTVDALPTGIDNILYSVTGTNETNVWATGGRGVALHYAGL